MHRPCYVAPPHPAPVGEGRRRWDATFSESRDLLTYHPLVWFVFTLAPDSLGSGNRVWGGQFDWAGFSSPTRCNGRDASKYGRRGRNIVCIVCCHRARRGGCDLLRQNSESNVVPGCQKRRDPKSDPGLVSVSNDRGPSLNGHQKVYSGKTKQGWNTGPSSYRRAVFLAITRVIVFGQSPPWSAALGRSPEVWLFLIKIGT